MDKRGRVRSLATFLRRARHQGPRRSVPGGSLYSASGSVGLFFSNFSSLPLGPFSFQLHAEDDTEIAGAPNHLGGGLPPRARGVGGGGRVRGRRRAGGGGGGGRNFPRGIAA